MTFSVTTAGLTIPVAIVAATANETKRAREVQNCGEEDGSRGWRARVETPVAIALAASWKPFVKSKKSATTTTATSRSRLSSMLATR